MDRRAVDLGQRVHLCAVPLRGVARARRRRDEGLRRSQRPHRSARLGEVAGQRLHVVPDHAGARHPPLRHQARLSPAERRHQRGHRLRRHRPAHPRHRLHQLRQPRHRPGHAARPRGGDAQGARRHPRPADPAAPRRGHRHRPDLVAPRLRARRAGAPRLQRLHPQEPGPPLRRAEAHPHRAGLDPHRRRRRWPLSGVLSLAVPPGPRPQGQPVVGLGLVDDAQRAGGLPVRRVDRPHHLHRHRLQPDHLRPHRRPRLRAR